MTTVYNTRKQDRPRSMHCGECGLSYVRSPSDQRRHRKYHDQTVYGIATRSTIHDGRVIWRDDCSLVSVVNSSSPMDQKKFAEKVAVVANRGTPFDFPSYIAGDCPDDHDGHAFILHSDGRVIGLLIVGKDDHIWPCTWEQYEKHQQQAELYRGLPTWPWWKYEAGEVPQLPVGSSIWSVYYVWIAPAHQRQGLGGFLFDRVAGFLGISPDQFGCGLPFTKSGEAWARRVWPQSFYVAL